MRAATIASAEIRLSQTARSRCMQRLNQSALSEVADVSAAGALDHVDGELEQADFPGIVYALDDGAERFVPVLNMRLDRKSTRLNSSHVAISYAVFCLKKKKKKNIHYQ